MRSTLVFVLVLAPCGWALSGCATGAGDTVDAGRPLRFDAGAPRDTGSSPFDAGDPSLIDAWIDPSVDAFIDPTVDGGASPDGAALRDAASTPEDAALPDGGPLCAGVDCSAMTTACTVGVCQPATGACTSMPRTDGTSCDDGDACTTGESCAAGSCGGGGALDCSGMSTECALGVCSAAAGGCTTMPRTDGTSCGVAGSCASVGSCMAGACAMSPAVDCSACGAGMVCAGGACGAPPSRLDYGFESGALPSGWMNGVGGTTGWSVISGGAHGGTYRVRSGAIGNSAQSRMSFTITISAPTTLSFWLMTSTESGFDFLEVYVDGARQGQWSGTTAWTQAAIPLAAGARTIEFRYVKDGSLTSGSDTVWIDDVSIGAGGNPNTGFEGSTALPGGYTTSGSAIWFVSTTMPHAGTYTAESGNISDSQTSSLSRSVTAPGATTVTFWYRVSSESSYDYLRFYIDGVQQGQWSGEVPWTLASYPMAAGTHTVEWRYSKDASVSTGADTAWVDDIDFGFVPSAMPICM